MPSRNDESKWRKAAANARTPDSRNRFLRLAQAEKLRSDIASCERCPLAKRRTMTVPFDQTSPKPIALVGEAPGKHEDLEGRPFVGRSGALLDRLIGDLGYSRDDVVVLNTVACRPPNNRDPKPEETEACRPLFERQLDFSGAWIVVLMGNKALQHEFPGKTISKARGNPMWKQGRIYVPAYHPAYILRNRRNESLLSNDLNLAFQIYRGDKWWDPLLTSVTKSKDGALRHALDNQGWALVNSERLNDQIIVTVDTIVKVPPKYGKLIRYTVEELVRLGELGHGTKLSHAELNGIHLVKRLGGVVIQ